MFGKISTWQKLGNFTEILYSQKFPSLAFGRPIQNMKNNNKKMVCGRVLFNWLLNYLYSHLSTNRGGWNKRVGVQKLQNQLDFFPSIRIKMYSSKWP